MNSSKFRIIFMFLLVLAIIGCSKNDSKLIGKWQHVQMNESVEFRADKTGIFDVLGNPPVSFKWSTLPDDKIQLLFSGPAGASKILTGKLEKEQFVLEGDKMKATYNKIIN